MAIDISAFDSAFIFVLPFLVSFLVKPDWDDKIKMAVSIVLATVFALVRTGLEGKFDVQHIALSLTYIIGISELFYPRILLAFRKQVATVEVTTGVGASEVPVVVVPTSPVTIIPVLPVAEETPEVKPL